MLTNHLVRDLDDHDLSVLHTRNTQNGLVGMACVNPVHKKISRPGWGGSDFLEIKRYEGVMFNVISVTRGWVGVQCPEK